MFLEMRTYVLKPGMTNNFVERFAEGLTARLQFSKLLGLWQSEPGFVMLLSQTEASLAASYIASRAPVRPKRPGLLLKANRRRFG